MAAAGFEAVELEDDDVEGVDGAAAGFDGLALDDPSDAPVLGADAADDEPSPPLVLPLGAAPVEELFPDRESVR